MNAKEAELRGRQLLIPIDRQIQMTDSREELLLLAFVMINKAKSLIDANLGEEKRKHLFKEFSE